MRKLGIQLAAAITISTALICVGGSVIAGRLAASKYIEVERARSESNTYVISSRVTGAVFMQNWAFIEGYLKPLALELGDLAYFYVEDHAGEIKVSSAVEMEGKSSQDIQKLITVLGEIQRKPRKFLEVSDEDSFVTVAVTELHSPLPVISKKILNAGTKILDLRYEIIKDQKLLGIIGFGINIQPELNLVFMAQMIGAALGILLSIVIGGLTLLITKGLTSPLSTMADQLNQCTNDALGFESSLRNFNFFENRVKSLELKQLQDAFGKFRSAILENIKVISRLRVSEAVAETTQMLAHDVRKPFILLRVGLESLSEARDPSEVKAIIQKMIPEIEKALKSVEGMIDDVMEVGSDSSKLMLEPVCPVILIESTLCDIKREFNKHNLKFAFDFQHNHMALVHGQKIDRVISNIVGNAIQATSGTGEIWFNTVERDGVIEFCIGNSGSFIPPENISKLFDAFFTSGKKDGTGLGLAIAQKVIRAHGGKIWCNSSKDSDFPNGKVEIYFTLLASEVSSMDLPKQNVQVNAAMDNLSNNQVGKNVRNPLNLLPEVLIVDDSVLILNAWQNKLGDTAVVHIMENLAELQTKVLQDPDFVNRLEFVVTDMYFENSIVDGLEVGKYLKALRPELLILLSSNGIFSTSDLEGIIDHVIEKKPVRLEMLNHRSKK